MNNPIIVLCGFSGSGKDTLLQEIKEQTKDYEKYLDIISCTSRPKRINEIEGKDYFFKSYSEMQELDSKNQLISKRDYLTKVNGKKEIWSYGILKENIKDNQNYVVVLDIEGLIDLKNIYGNRVISFFLDVPDKVREKRAKQRGSFCQVEWDRRLEDDKKKYSKDFITKNVDYILPEMELNDLFLNIIIKSMLYSKRDEMVKKLLRELQL